MHMLEQIEFGRPGAYHEHLFSVRNTFDDRMQIGLAGRFFTAAQCAPVVVHMRLVSVLYLL